MRKLKLNSISIRKANSMEFEGYFETTDKFNYYAIDALSTVENEDHLSFNWKNATLTLSKIRMDEFLTKNNDILSIRDIDKYVIGVIIGFCTELTRIDRQFERERREFLYYYIRRYKVLIDAMDTISRGLEELYIHSAKHQSL